MTTQLPIKMNLDPKRRLTKEFEKFPRSALDQSIPARFAEIVERYPDRLALRTQSGALTYGELNRQVNRIGRAICDAGQPVNEPILLICEHDWVAIAAILGILKSGNFYCCLDLTLPRTQLHALVSELRPRLAIADYANGAMANELASKQCRVLPVESLLNSDLDADWHLHISPDAIAYAFFTSGTTGRPKGVVDSHRNVLHNILRYTNNLHISSTDRLTLLQALSFSGSVSSLFSALLNGAAVFPFDVRRNSSDSLVNWLADNKISIYHSVPAIFRLVAADGQRFSEMRIIRLEGDQASVADVELFQKYFPPSSILVNGLGATECGLVRQYFIDKDTPTPQSLVPIGYTVEDMEILLLDDSGQEVATDSVGEITVRSQFLALGYWQRPDLTEAAFRSDPKGNGMRTYHTGDLGRMGADGCLEYLGRKDFQTKIRGQWVEIPEIERTLSNFGKFKDVVVLIREDPGPEPRLVAYLVPISSPVPKIEEIRNYLAEWLPATMIPSAFLMMDSLPLNSSGKLDRGALPAPDQGRPNLMTPYAAPNNFRQLQMTQIWEEILRVHPIGIHDDFFDLGSQSLSAARLITELEKATSLTIPFQQLLTNSTVEKLSLFLGDESTESTAPIIQIQAGCNRRPFYFLHGDYVSAGLYCVKLARQLGSEQPFYALPPCGTNGHPVPVSYAEMARIHIDVLRAQQPVGPYILGGTCNGGLVAFEMARQLVAQGETVAALVLIAASARNLRYKRLRRILLPLRFLSHRAESSLTVCLQPVWDILMEMSLYQKLQYIVIKLPRFLRELVGLLLNKQGRDGGEKMAGREECRARLRETYLRIDAEYMPGDYPGRISVLWADGENEGPTEAISWWRQVVPQAELHILPGTPHSSSLTEHAAAVAGIIKSCIT